MIDKTAGHAALAKIRADLDNVPAQATVKVDRQPSVDREWFSDNMAELSAKFGRFTLDKTNRR